MRLSKAMVTALLFIAAAGCVRHRAVTAPARTLTLDCVELPSVDRWRVLDSYHIVVYMPDRSAAYLVEFEQPCGSSEPPDHVEAAGAETGRLCASGRDALLVNQQRCLISTILRYKTSP